jgi:hypothetical protein
VVDRKGFSGKLLPEIPCTIPMANALKQLINNLSSRLECGQVIENKEVVIARNFVPKQSSNKNYVRRTCNYFLFKYNKINSFGINILTGLLRSARNDGYVIGLNTFSAKLIPNSGY